MNETLSLVQELNGEWANFYCAMAYPGSKLHEQAREQGIQLPEDNGGPGWVGYSQHSFETMPLPTETLSSAEVLRFRDNAVNQYYTSSKYLDMIQNTFGLKARQHIEKMTQQKLKRKILMNN